MREEFVAWFEPVKRTLSLLGVPPLSICVLMHVAQDMEALRAEVERKDALLALLEQQLKATQERMRQLEVRPRVLPPPPPVPRSGRGDTNAYLCFFLHFLCFFPP